MLDSDELSLDEELDSVEPLETDIDKALDDIDAFSETDDSLDAETLDLVDAPEETSASESDNIMLDSDELSLDESGHAQKLSEISEERIEALITKTVQDVVEKVARETMTTVAEKLINDAIEALKQTLEPSDS